MIAFRCPTCGATVQVRVPPASPRIQERVLAWCAGQPSHPKPVAMQRVEVASDLRKEGGPTG